MSAATGSSRPNGGSPPPGPGPIDPALIPTESDGEGDPTGAASVGVVAVAAAVGSLRDVEPGCADAGTAVSDGTRATVGAGIGVAEGFGARVGAGRGFGVGVGVGRGLGVGVGVGAGVGVGEATGVGFGVEPGVGDGCVVGAGVGLGGGGGGGGGGGVGVGGGREGDGVTCGFLAGTKRAKVSVPIAGAELAVPAARGLPVCAAIGWTPDTRDSMTRPANPTA